ncbi:sigma 54-interacting transcriptional regulator [Chitinivorax sp. B]|uniref:sigma 54-interacting transcriptional regulator n=1 Tax=Chitinivorax sp. B TaxID=2502235 RepID=UPI0010F77F23|nr:sigma 54-interacting transcriptional regulator [Chitinivorax sp. B]
MIEHDNDSTLTSPVLNLGNSLGFVLGMTVLWHTDPAMIGAQWVASAGHGPITLNRFAPLFLPVDQMTALPLGHQGVSRAPTMLMFTVTGALQVLPPDSRMLIELDGVAISGPTELTPDHLERGVVLGLGGVVLLCLHRVMTLPRRGLATELIGVGSAMTRVRELVAQAAGTDLPVLLLGETGSGKEVAARAIHRLSRRRDKPMVSVNMATLSESLAAADLFGVTKGAYTGAQSQRPGLFAEAGEGTLFLDEIGDTPSTVQPMLLRVLETSEYRPLGATRNEVSRARLIAATDRRLGPDSFNQPLLRRLEALVIHIPPLRARREDMGVLIHHLLAQWQIKTGASAKLPISFITELCCYDWPGNVRQLAHVLQNAVLTCQRGEWPRLHDLAGDADRWYPVQLALTPTPVPMPVQAAPTRQAPSTLTDAQVVAALDRSGWRIRAAAVLLGISRPSLYALIESNKLIRQPDAIGLEELRAALLAADGDIDQCAAQLKTPREALRRQLKLQGLLG